MCVWEDVVGTRKDNFIPPNDEVELLQSKDLQRASNNSVFLEKYFPLKNQPGVFMGY